jgi:hypothetical protein
MVRGSARSKPSLAKAANAGTAEAPRSAMAYEDYLRDGYWVIDGVICRGEDYADEHPEIYGRAGSPQGERSWGTWWMRRAYDRIVQRGLVQ